MRYLEIVALVAVVFVACSDDAGDAPPSSAVSDAGTGSDAPSDAGTEASSSTDAKVALCSLSSNERSTLHGVVRHLQSGTSPPLAGVAVCVDGRTDIACATTASDGSYVHDCVPVGDSLIRFALVGYAPTTWARFSLAFDDNELGAFLLRDEDNAALFGDAGVTYPRVGYGLVGLNDVTDIDGITMAAVSSGMDGPYYSADGMSLDPAATGTVGDGVVFFVAPVGKAEIRITSPNGGACGQLGGGWGGATPNTIAVPVFENGETDLFVRCR